MSVGSAIHISPVAYKKCYKLSNEYDGIINFINHITFKNAADTIFSFGLNIIFNSADLFYELVLL
jgi:hypothetical protein